LSNVVKLQPGLNTIEVELWNEYAPSGSNQSSSAMWIVVKCLAGQSCQNGSCVGAVTPPVTQQNLPSVTDPVIYFNGNIAGVQNNPTRETTFTISAAHRVTFIYTYHYFNNGKLPGTIALRHSDGTVYGPWQAEGALGQGGVKNAYWFVRPNVEIKAGSYTVVDSDKATWSHNSGSAGAGFVEIKGIRTGTAPVVQATIASFTWVDKSADKVGQWGSGRPEGTLDGRFGLQIIFTAPTELTSIAIYSVNDAGALAGGQVWHSKSSSYWMLGVFQQGRQLNASHVKTLGTFNGRQTFDLYCNDSGWFKSGQNFLVEVEYGAGLKVTKMVKLSQTTPPVTQQNLPSVTDPVIYFNGNIAGVQNGPTRETTFTINASHRVTFIYTYHYFNNGKLPGTIALRHSDGTVHGPWQAEGALGQGGVKNAYWFVRPNVEIKAGSYTVVDSDKATWSHNSGSSGAGFVEIKGIKTGTPPSAFGEKELLANGSLGSLSGWTIHRWMQSTGDRDEVTRESDGVKFRNTSVNTRMGIMQTINADVSGAQKLILKAVVKAVQQTLTGTGWQGREAPVAVMVTYTDVSGVVRNGLGSMANPSESQANRMFWHGFYYANPTGNSQTWHGTKVSQGSWLTYEVDLMSLNPKPKIIHAVGAEGSGWPTREGKIASISLKYYGTLAGK
jgi:hypothetical protein